MDQAFAKTLREFIVYREKAHKWYNLSSFRVAAKERSTRKRWDQTVRRIVHSTNCPFNIYSTFRPCTYQSLNVTSDICINRHAIVQGKSTACDVFHSLQHRRIGYHGVGSRHSWDDIPHCIPDLFTGHSFNFVLLRPLQRQFEQLLEVIWIV